MVAYRLESARIDAISEAEVPVYLPLEMLRPYRLSRASQSTFLLVVKARRCSNQTTARNRSVAVCSDPAKTADPTKVTTSGSCKKSTPGSARALKVACRASES